MYKIADKSFSEYLKVTDFCDVDNLHIKKIAEYIKDKTGGDIHRSVEEVFYFVRDHVYYRLGDWQKKASRTLLERSGSCTNSANLFVAITRAMGIPAGYGVMQVKGQEYFGLAAPRRLSRYVKKVSIHIYAYVFINDSWMPIDPSDDILLSVGSQAFNTQSTIAEFDKNKGACLCLAPEHVISDEGPLASIDKYMLKKMRFVSKIAAKLGNKYISFLREDGVSYQNAQQAQEAFPNYLWRKGDILTLISYQILGVL